MASQTRGLLKYYGISFYGLGSLSRDIFVFTLQCDLLWYITWHSESFNSRSKFFNYKKNSNPESFGTLKADKYIVIEALTDKKAYATICLLVFKAPEESPLRFFNRAPWGRQAFCSKRETGSTFYGCQSHLPICCAGLDGNLTT